MKVKIEYTIEVPDSYRRAISEYMGEEGLATRAEVKNWYQAYGENEGDIRLQDQMRDWDNEDDDEEDED